MYHNGVTDLTEIWNQDFFLWLCIIWIKIPILTNRAMHL